MEQPQITEDDLAEHFRYVWPAQGGTYSSCRLCKALVLAEDRLDHITWHLWLASLITPTPSER